MIAGKLSAEINNRSLPSNLLVFGEDELKHTFVEIRKR